MAERSPSFLERLNKWQQVSTPATSPNRHPEPSHTPSSASSADETVGQGLAMSGGKVTGVRTTANRPGLNFSTRSSAPRAAGSEDKAPSNGAEAAAASGGAPGRPGLGGPGSFKRQLAALADVNVAWGGAGGGEGEGAHPEPGSPTLDAEEGDVTVGDGEAAAAGTGAGVDIDSRAAPPMTVFHADTAAPPAGGGAGGQMEESEIVFIPGFKAASSHQTADTRSSGPSQLGRASPQASPLRSPRSPARSPPLRPKQGGHSPAERLCQSLPEVGSDLLKRSDDGRRSMTTDREAQKFSEKVKEGMGKVVRRGSATFMKILGLENTEDDALSYSEHGLPPERANSATGAGVADNEPSKSGVSRTYSVAASANMLWGKSAKLASSTSAKTEVHSVSTQSDPPSLGEFSPVQMLLRDVCIATGFAYGEVWSRQQLTEKSRRSLSLFRAGSFGKATNLTPTISRTPTNKTLDGKNRLTDTHSPSAEGGGTMIGGIASLMSHLPGLNRENIDTPESPPGTPLGGLRNPPRGEKSRPTSAVVGGGGDIVHNAEHAISHMVRTATHKSDEETPEYDSKLKFSGYAYAHAEAFERGIKNGQCDASWRELTNWLTEHAHGKKVWYEEGKGFPGAAWARRDIDFHDLANMPDDDDLIADKRVQKAKTMFDVSVGIPCIEYDGTCTSVIMLYRINQTHSDRPNRNWKELRKMSNFMTIMYSCGTTGVACIALQNSLPGWSRTLTSIPGHFQRLSSGGSLSIQDQKEASQDDDKTTGKKFRHFWRKYFMKFKGQNQQPPGGHTWEFASWAFIGTFVALLFVTGLDREFQKRTYNDNKMYILVNSMAALGAMIFSAPTSLLVQPRNIFGGHIISGTIGVALDYLVVMPGGLPLYLACAIGPACTVFIMAKLGIIHPPAVAVCVIYLNDVNRFRTLQWLFLAAPLMLDCVIMVTVGVLVNNLSKERNYPLYW